MQTWEECAGRKRVLAKSMVNTIGDDGSAVVGISCSAQDRQNPSPDKAIGQGIDRSREAVTSAPEGLREVQPFPPTAQRYVFPHSRKASPTECAGGAGGEKRF
jgi:hypothetical protein